MRLKALLADDENAVSPVIGVILMVAITVILAAVIASFVLGLGPSDAAPTVNFDSSTNSSALIIEVTGGDSVPADQLSLTGDVDWDWGTNNATGSADGETAIQAGDTKAIDFSSLSDPYEVNVVWNSESGGSTQTLATFEGEQ